MGLPKVFLTVYACFYKKYAALGSKMFDSHFATQLLCNYNYVFTLLTMHCKQLALDSRG
jgi:hypothetical protein